MRLFLYSLNHNVIDNLKYVWSQKAVSFKHFSKYNSQIYLKLVKKKKSNDDTSIRTSNFVHTHTHTHTHTYIYIYIYIYIACPSNTFKIHSVWKN